VNLKVKVKISRPESLEQSMQEAVVAESNAYTQGVIMPNKNNNFRNFNFNNKNKWNGNNIQIYNTNINNQNGRNKNNAQRNNKYNTDSINCDIYLNKTDITRSNIGRILTIILIIVHNLL